jgi:phosphoglucomutase
MNAVRDARIKLGVDPLGGAGIDYWPRIAERVARLLTTRHAGAFVPLEAPFILWHEAPSWR